ncbi:MAG: hypothetical protein HYV16_13520 [Gammaproteobacteria bacterium]|nr:hypothetical protein [Gammaproteobacteria bacterium]
MSAVSSKPLLRPHLDYVGHPIKIRFARKTVEAIFAGWFLDVPVVLMLDDDGYLTGKVHALKDKDIVDLPPIIGDPPAIYCRPNTASNPKKH